MRTYWSFLYALSVLTPTVVVSARADIVAWSENAMVKVKPTDLPQQMPRDISISAARNEYEAFQIIIRAQGHPLRGVNVELTDFISERGSRISCQANCTLYQELYIKIVRPSGPYGALGEWPDALVPKVDRYFGERRNAFPFDVERDRNQPVWVDVFVPSGTPPGLYTAYATVHAQGEKSIRIATHLTVWDFTLPATSSIRNSFFLFGGALPYGHGASFKGETLDGLVKTYSVGLLAHRLSNGWLIGGYDWQPSPLTQWGVDSLTRLKQEWGPFFDGSILPGGPQITAVVPLSQMCVDGELTFWRGTPDLIAWRYMCGPDVINFFATAGWLDRMAFYLPDEPNLDDPNVVGQLKSMADSIHQRDIRLRTLLTKRYSDLVEPQIDIWVVPVPALQESFENGSYSGTYAKEIAHGKEVWLYQACFTHEAACGWTAWYPGMSGWPDYMIDMQGMKNRIQDWVNWRFKIQGELYWGVNYTYYESDVFQNQFIAGGNGDGNFFYPGTPQRIGGKTDIPIESIRLKLKREGLEDYEYLALLARNGDAAFADRKVSGVVRSARDWEQDPDVLYRVRSELAARLEVLLRSRMSLAGTVSTTGVNSQVTLAPGSMAAVSGSDLASKTENAVSEPLPTTLGGTVVVLEGKPAPLIFVSPEQISLQVPWELRGQTQASLTVTSGGGTKGPLTVRIAPVSPSILTIGASGSNRGSIVIASTGEFAAPGGSLPGRLARPANRGEIISIFCTGLGNVTNRPGTGVTASADPLSETIFKPTVTIGGIPAEVSFSGLAPFLVGLYQVNVQVPTGAPTGDAVPVTLTYGSVNSNTATIAVQ